MTVGVNSLLEGAFILPIPENLELSSLRATMDYQRKVMEHVTVELQAKQTLEIDIITIKNLIREFQEQPGTNNTKQSRRNRKKCVRLLRTVFMGYHFFHNPKIFTLEMVKNMLQTESKISHGHIQ